MQRTAVQASPDMLTAIGGRWVTGARRTDDGVHPFRKSLAELRIGDSVTAGPRAVTLADIEHFAEFTGDTFYAHMDEEAAAANPLFGGRVAHGYLIVSWAAGLFVDPDPGPVLANYGVDNLRFLTPVKPGEELTVTLTAKQISPRGGAEHGEVRWDAVVVNSEGSPVATYDVLTMVAKTWPPAGARFPWPASLRCVAFGQGRTPSRRDRHAGLGHHPAARAGAVRLLERRHLPRLRPAPSVPPHRAAGVPRAGGDPAARGGQPRADPLPAAGHQPRRTGGRRD